MKGWLSSVLDAEMKAETERCIEEMERCFNHRQAEAATALRSREEVREMLAILWSRDGQGNGPLIELLRDPAAVLSMTVREFIAANWIEGRRPGPPKKAVHERRAGTVTWRAEEEAKRLRQLLVEFYPQAPRRAVGGVASVANIADEIAAARWDITEDTLMEFKKRPRGDRRRV
jgi:hypothetical protein